MGIDDFLRLLKNGADRFQYIPIFTQTIKRRIPGCRCTCLKMKMLSCWRSSNFRNVSLKRHVGKNKKKACRKSMGHFNATTCSGGIKLDAQMYGMFC